MLNAKIAPHPMQFASPMPLGTVVVDLELTKRAFELSQFTYPSGRRRSAGTNESLANLLANPLTSAVPGKEIKVMQNNDKSDNTTTTEVSIKVRNGDIEFSYAGPEKTFMDEFLPITKELLSTTPPLPATSTIQVVSPPTIEDKPSINHVCEKMNASKGKKFVIAAVTFLYLSNNRNRDTFSRDEIKSVAESENRCTTPSFPHNLSKYLKQLHLSGELIRKGEGDYAISERTLSLINRQFPPHAASNGP